MRHLGLQRAFHEPERRTPMRLDGNALPTSRIGVRRYCKVHGPNALPNCRSKLNMSLRTRQPVAADVRKRRTSIRLLTSAATIIGEKFWLTNSNIARPWKAAPPSWISACASASELGAEVRDGRFQAFRQGHLRFPSQPLSRPRDVRPALFGIVLRQRPENDSAARAGGPD